MSHSGPENRIRVLIVDNPPVDPDSRSLAKQLADEKDIDVISTVYSAVEGLATAQQQRPDIILWASSFDITPIERAVWIRILRAQVPSALVILVTLSMMGHDLRDYVLAGVRELLIKPPTQEELLIAIRRTHATRDLPERAFGVPQRIDFAHAIRVVVIDEEGFSLKPGDHDVDIELSAVFRSMAEGVEVVRREETDVLVLGFGPAGPTLQAAETALVLYREGRGLQIIVLFHAAPVDKPLRSLMGSGVAEFHTKPISTEELVASIRRAYVTTHPQRIFPSFQSEQELRLLIRQGTEHQALVQKFFESTALGWFARDFVETLAMRMKTEDALRGREPTLVETIEELLQHGNRDIAVRFYQQKMDDAPIHVAFQAIKEIEQAMKAREPEPPSQEPEIRIRVLILDDPEEHRMPELPEEHPSLVDRIRDALFKPAPRRAKQEVWRSPSLSETLAAAEKIEVIATVHSAEEGLALAKQSKPDIVIWSLTVGMAASDWAMWIRTLRREVPTAQVILTLHATALDGVSEGIRAGAREFLIKPPDSMHLK
ncbi:MAG: hypothetical protein H0T73_10620, partial [Ardenticatenales bacterium]|nr:hypothetical protein [Ardenticatenales bacterium]